MVCKEIWLTSPSASHIASVLHFDFLFALKLWFSYLQMFNPSTTYGSGHGVGVWPGRGLDSNGRHPSGWTLTRMETLAEKLLSAALFDSRPRKKGSEVQFWWEPPRLTPTLQPAPYSYIAFQRMHQWITYILPALFGYTFTIFEDRLWATLWTNTIMAPSKQMPFCFYSITLFLAWKPPCMLGFCPCHLGSDLKAILLLWYTSFNASRGRFSVLCPQQPWSRYSLRIRAQGYLGTKSQRWKAYQNILL